MPRDHFGTKHFGKSHFGMDVSSREHFGTCTIRRCRRSGRWTFQHGNALTWGLFGTRNFRHEEFWAQEHFGTGTFQYMDIFGTVAQVPKRPYCFAKCQNIHVSKCSGAEKSLCRNVPHAENSSCRKFPMLKRSRVETSICRNVRSAERCMC